MNEEIVKKLIEKQEQQQELSREMIELMHKLLPSKKVTRDYWDDCTFED